MIINHNINAMNAHRNMAINTVKSGKAAEKLSSGLRINRAGDDAAGLAISEKMRAQIRGLEQASRNAQDAISLIQTAEGALNETHSIVQRMRELSVQAANDTNTEDDRNNIQKEINQLIAEVDRIGNTTEFNTIKLLNSGSENLEVRENILKGLKTGWLEKAGEIINNAYGIEGTGTKKLQIFLDEGTPYGELAHVRGTFDVLELHIDISDFEKGDGESGNNIHGKLYNDRIIAHEMTHAVMNDALGIDKMNDLHKNNKVWFIEGTAEGIAGADERLKRVIGKPDQSGIDTTKLNSLASRANALLNGATWKGDDLDYAAGYVMVKYIKEEAHKDLKNVMTSIKADGNKGLETSIDITNLKTNFETNIKNYVNDNAKVTLNWGAHENDVGSILGSNHGGVDIKAEDVIKGTTAVTEQPLAGKFQIIWSDENNSNSELTIQVGANAAQTLNIGLRDMRASALGLSGLQITDNKKASEAIGKCDSAISRVSTFRSSLGACQNRLEHTIANLDNTAENLSASESRIRDVDMAKEMMNFSKNNILMQAAQSMLVQANGQPQGILQLLR
ncbi:flagellinolysin [Clostridium cochlearium]|uniref:flagellinolysin n=1 Tax=Clostridium cochlearium TaxID=1494 RepID=UPI0024203A82|nr:flagellinolysin [Clostridium cochlearium]